MPTSPDTLLRRIKDAPAAPVPAPRYIGVDDWALRKGQRYGTIVIDLERGQVLDLLEGRDGEALKAWLKEHPGVEVITRDRATAYADGATRGAPSAVQVADRFHLVKNLGEALLQVVTAHRRPETPYAEGPRAAELGATAMIDVSDGLVADAAHIASASGVRINLRSSALAKIVNTGTNAGALTVFALQGHVLWGVGLAMAIASVIGANARTSF